jgi:hypothetical protein
MYCPDFAIFGFKTPETESKKPAKQAASATPPAAVAGKEAQDAR